MTTQDTAAPAIERPLTMREAARLLGVHEETLGRIVDRGEIVATRVGARRRIEPAELRRYLEAGRETGAAA